LADGVLAAAGRMPVCPRQNLVGHFREVDAVRIDVPPGVPRPAALLGLPLFGPLLRHLLGDPEDVCPRDCHRRPQQKVKSRSPGPSKNFFLFFSTRPPPPPRSSPAPCTRRAAAPGAGQTLPARIASPAVETRASPALRSSCRTAGTGESGPPTSSPRRKCAPCQVPCRPASRTPTPAPPATRP